MTDLRFDVVIFERKTGRVDRIVGKAMCRDTGFYNAETRLETARGRCNRHYDAMIVQAGAYTVGDYVIEPHADGDRELS